MTTYQARQSGEQGSYLLVTIADRDGQPFAVVGTDSPAREKEVPPALDANPYAAGTPDITGALNWADKHARKLGLPLRVELDGVFWSAEWGELVR